MEFDINKYPGVWYELMHYPSWFPRNDNYNTVAEYTLNGDGTLTVHNSTISCGQRFDSYGTARSLGGTNFRVDFPMPEVAKLAASGQFIKATVPTNTNTPNYVIEKIWSNVEGQYIFVVVTDPAHSSLYVLSRFRYPSISLYNMIMAYVVANFGRDRLVQTPHFDDHTH